jgi:excinuclease ABC subunit C
MDVNKVKKLAIPQSPGIYQFKDARDKIIYIGKAADLRARVLSYWRKNANHSPAKYSMLKRVNKIEWIETDSEIEALLLEANLIKKYQPQYNIVMRDDKRYVYIKITTEDEVPGVFITRKIDKSGKYFGPFTSVEAVKQTLKAIRKIWPYCTARKRQNLPAGKAGKPCFYYQINRCLGVCGGVVSKKEYLEKVIKPIVLFLEGKRREVIKNYELKIKNYEKYNTNDANNMRMTRIKNKKQNEIDLLKYQLVNLKRVLEHTKILSVSDKYANDVIELAKVLGLPKVPERIEGYDISNIFAQNAVGSMVVFSGGEPEKSEYRKFKIRIGQGEANDVGMLKEVLERRFLRYRQGIPKDAKERQRNKIENRQSKIENPQWPLPDLIIVDGGKAQLNTVMKVLKRVKLNIPVIAISKGAGLRSAGAPDKLFFPGEKKPLELPLASPALHLIKRVRDEAHRFAVTYHRKLRIDSKFKF